MTVVSLARAESLDSAVRASRTRPAAASAVAGGPKLTGAAVLVNASGAQPGDGASGSVRGAWTYAPIGSVRTVNPPSGGSGGGSGGGSLGGGSSGGGTAGGDPYGGNGSGFGALVTPTSTATVVDGKLTLPVSVANTFSVRLDQDVTQVEFVGWPEGVSERVVLYLEQGPGGPYTVDGWPYGTLSPGGVKPTLTAAPGAVDALVLDTVDGGDTVYLNVIAYDYLP